MYPDEQLVEFEHNVQVNDLEQEIARLQQENEILINDLGHIAHDIGAVEFSTLGVLNRVKELLETEAKYKGAQK